ncbi:hypothetical protein [Mesorhizobium sp. M1365]|uniref:hypothetical protein n=1 Tax=Mesorhizobium sp. M1365 TaxID=2957090 RepID=UPI00333D40B0
MFVGALLTILGLLIGGGGAWLIALCGSWHYLPAGIALLAAGSLLLAGNAAGVWLYILTWLATLAPGATISWRPGSATTSLPTHCQKADARR